MREGTRRTPSGRAGYGNVALFWYTRPGSQRLASTRGQAVDHLAFAVADLDAWVAKLQRENVRILRPVYPFGSARAVLIDTWRQATADHVDDVVLVRPGSDGALALGMLHVLVRDGLVDRAYIA